MHKNKNVTEHVKFGAMHMRQARNAKLSPCARKAHAEAAAMHAQAALFNLRAGRTTRRTTRRTRPARRA